MYLPYHTTNWENIPVRIHKGEKGEAIWKTIEYAGLRIRLVEYFAGYLADHWCSKGHIIYCIEGEMESWLEDGSKHILKKGMSYQVSDGASSHKSFSLYGAKLFIIDGDFLK
jgi:hypothetical protein